MNCYGCRSDQGHFIRFTACPIRKCCQERNISECTSCEEYESIDMLKAFYSITTHKDAKENLDKIRMKTVRKWQKSAREKVKDLQSKNFKVWEEIFLIIIMVTIVKSKVSIGVKNDWYWIQTSPPTWQEYFQLISSTGWMSILKIPEDDLKRVFEGTWYWITAYQNGSTVGCGRLLLDGALYALIQASGQNTDCMYRNYAALKSAVYWWPCTKLCWLKKLGGWDKWRNRLKFAVPPLRTQSES